jgi:CRISPR/Cas system CSM-associated protein Csm5 (group 7 of RAMP superfamily)
MTNAEIIDQHNMDSDIRDLIAEMNHNNAIRQYTPYSGFEITETRRKYHLLNKILSNQQRSAMYMIEIATNKVFKANGYGRADRRSVGTVQSLTKEYQTANAELEQKHELAVCHLLGIDLFENDTTPMKLEPNCEQLNALKLFAEANGRTWKTKLNTLWMNGYGDAILGGADTAYLQQVRNNFGPTWLTKFKFPSWQAIKMIRGYKVYGRKTKDVIVVRLELPGDTRKFAEWGMPKLLGLSLAMEQAAAQTKPVDIKE